MSWVTEDRVSAIHVVPLDDLIEHARSTECTCCPRVVLLGYTCCGGKLAVRKQVVHEAMDGRQ